MLLHPRVHARVSALKVDRNLLGLKAMGAGIHGREHLLPIALQDISRRETGLPRLALGGEQVQGLRGSGHWSPTLNGSDVDT